ncbi:CCR4-NOT transcription complex subunit 9-like [Triticum dicoccoides]|uniref:CCR4-NOT transcription complex subunit 9-like n=1 Tax=Triticum dicoccoides TaxID=85692 RepID=UPI00188ED7B2|nr:CCR4-NOT transcription complex subunit 9-like [Triticum dicoccoides]
MVTANLQRSLAVPPSIRASPSPTAVGAAVVQEGNGRDLDSAEQLVLDLCDPALREHALLVISKKKEIFQDALAPLLWYSFGTIAALLKEIVSIYPALDPPTLSLGASNRACNVLALFQCIASHPKTRMLFLNANIPIFMYPFMVTKTNTRPLEHLRLASLGVIGALVKTDDPGVVEFLLRTEIIPTCLFCMENGDELSKTVATFIVRRIICDDLGLRYICTNAERLLAVVQVLAQMVNSEYQLAVASVQRYPAKLLKHVIRCFHGLSADARACAALQIILPDVLKDGKVDTYLVDDLATRRCLQQLLHNVKVGGMGGAPRPGLDHMMGILTI